MTVYVDNMKARFGRMVMCHMIADTDEELHAMASLIGVARKWHQVDHYDIALSKRALAVGHGAQSISMRLLGQMVFNRRCGWPIGTPSTCEQIARDRRAAARAVQK